MMVKQIISIVIILVPSFIFGYLNKPAEMGLMIIASSIAVAFLYIDKIQKIKGGGFEAEMRKVVVEAYATLDNLRELSIPLITTLLDTLTYSGTWGGISIEKKHQLKDDLLNLKEKLDLKNEKIEESILEFHSQHTWSRMEYFANEFIHKSLDKNRIKYSEPLNLLKNRKSREFPSKEDILKAIDIAESELTQDEKQLLDEYEYYMTFGKLQKK